jgi:hypothetical protein
VEPNAWRLSGEVVGEKFQSERAAEFGVLGLVDDTYTASIERSEDVVVREAGGAASPIAPCLARKNSDGFH